MRYLEQTADHYKKISPWTPVYGLARTLLATGTLLTLLFNDSATMFGDSANPFLLKEGAASALYNRINLFALFSPETGIAKLIAIIIMLVVISGWRPAITGIFHFWVAFSFSNATMLVDGGDSITTILTFLLIPVTITDGRKNHWQAAQSSSDPYITLFAWSIFFLIRLQVAFIYFHAGIEKLQVEEWINGTAVYYWFTNTAHGAALWLRPALMQLLGIPWIVVGLSWGTILFEILLGVSLLRKRNGINWKLLLVAGILFHLGIVLVFGLVSFYFAMCACLVLYLMPLDYKWSTVTIYDHHPVILFDGDCSFCNRNVQLLLRYDTRKRYRYAPLQSAYGQAALQKIGLPASQLNTIVLLTQEGSYTRSAAVLRIVSGLGGWWRIASVLLLVPPFIRNQVYDIVSRYRHSLSPQSPVCVLPDEETRMLFIGQ